MKRAVLLLTMAPALAWAQDIAAAIAQGERVFAQTCATGYCHGTKGASGGAPRLAGRGFSQATINRIVSQGVPGTAMPAFGISLPRPELAAVIAYVAALNGIANPTVNLGPGGPPLAGSAPPALSGEAARGQALFSEAVRSFGRCSTCHEVNGIGIPVATPIDEVPANVAALRALETPGIATATVAGEAMPALVLSNASRGVILYDLTTAPPVQRTLEPGQVQLRDGNGWRHSSVIGGYNDGELNAMLAYLRAAIR
jgi:mono/diheme cytochrome c family protein